MDRYAQFLDEPKAFDGVNTLYIFTKLLRRDAPGYSVVLLLRGYVHHTMQCLLE